MLKAGRGLAGFRLARQDLAERPLRDPWMIVVLAGQVCWLVAYILIIVQCFHQQSYGLPLFAVALNFTWEVLYGLFRRPQDSTGHLDVVTLVVTLAWAALDGVIVYQVFRYGAAEFQDTKIGEYFDLVFVFVLGLAYFAHHTFARFYPSQPRPLSGMLINLVMSALFIQLFLSRPDGHGISLGGAWFRVAGNALIALANWFLMRNDPEKARPFFRVLLIGTTVLDLFFIGLVTDVIPWRAASPTLPIRSP